MEVKKTYLKFYNQFDYNINEDVLVVCIWFDKPEPDKYIDTDKYLFPQGHIRNIGSIAKDIVTHIPKDCKIEQIYLPWEYMFEKETLGNEILNILDTEKNTIKN
jgi:hypothetical protein